MDNGNTGTQAEFLEWLKGAAGEQGIQGEKGDKGDQGEQGLPGEKGDIGVGIEKVEYDANGDLLITFTDGTTQTVAMPEKHVHTFGDWVAFTTEEVSCENRLFFRACATCNTIEWKHGTKNDHDWTTQTIKPTCQAQGYDKKTCTICDKVEKVNYTAIAVHGWEEEYRYDNSYHWKKCQYCEEIDGKAEHTEDESGFCTVCDAAVGSTEGLIYDFSADRTYAEVIGYEGTSTRVKIAEEYEGVPVTGIYDGVFQYNTVIRSVVIPDGVTSIGGSAFYNCYSLTNVVIPDSVTSIGDEVF